MRFALENRKTNDLQIFGHIFKDSEVQYHYFRPNGKNVVNPNPVWCMLALFCSDSPFSKWLYFYELYFQALESPLEVIFFVYILAHHFRLP
jgi:hypothetical protein